MFIFFSFAIIKNGLNIEMRVQSSVALSLELLFPLPLYCIFAAIFIPIHASPSIQLSFSPRLFTHSHRRTKGAAGGSGYEQENERASHCIQHARNIRPSECLSLYLFPSFHSYLYYLVNATHLTPQSIHMHPKLSDIFATSFFIQISLYNSKQRKNGELFSTYHRKWIDSGQRFMHSQTKCTKF